MDNRTDWPRIGPLNALLEAGGLAAVAEGIALALFALLVMVYAVVSGG